MTLAHWGSRLGFAAKIAGAPIKTADLRRPQNHPHLRHSLTMMDEVIDYLVANDIRMYRMPGDFCPYATAPKYPDFYWRGQFEEAADDIERIGKRIRDEGIRLSFHPGQYTVLNSPRPEVVSSALAELEWMSELLDRFGCGREASVLLHVGGVYGDRPAAASRMLVAIDRLPDNVRARFALENDDVSWPIKDVLDICGKASVPAIFDFHHHASLNHGEPWQDMLAASLDTWSEGVRPKTHLSSPRDKNAPAGKLAYRAHADYIDGKAAKDIFEQVQKMNLQAFDVMLEAKKKDLAVLNLRKYLAL